MNGGHYFAYLDLNRWTQAGGGSGGVMTNNVQPHSPVRASSVGAAESGAHGMFTPTAPTSAPPSMSMKGGKGIEKEGKGYKGKWVVCDDERVQRIKSVEGAGSSSYVLFWRLRE